jgi:hypothetical protein
MQTAWVIEDIGATERFFVDNFGVKRWVRLNGIHFPPETCTYRDQPADFVIDVSMAYLGDMQLELIQPVRGESIYADHLSKHGGGLHHLCMVPADFGAAVAAAKGAGIGIAQRGSMADGAMHFAYVDGAHVGVPYLELAKLEPMMVDFFDSIREQTT